MAMQQNQYYQDPSAEIGANLGRALFGDPAMAMKQAQLRAEQAQREAMAREADAHAKLFASQASGQDWQNTSAQGLPAAIAALHAPPVNPAAMPDSLDGFMAAPSPPSSDEVFKNSIGRVIASLAGVQGDKVDTAKTVGSLASFLGGDELARRGLVAQGQTPTKDFAITPERADVVAANLATSKLREALGVAQTNHATDIPVANIQAATGRAVAGINHSNDIPVAQIAAGSREDVANIKTAGAPVADGRAAVLSVYPNARITDNVRDPNSALGRANPDSWHNHSKAAVDIAPMPGISFEQYIQGYRDKGYSIIEARNETGAGKVPWATGDNWHVVLGQPGGAKGGKAAAPKQVSAADMKVLNGELIAQMGVADWSQAPFDNKTKANLRARAAENFQRTGNPVLAAQQSIQANIDMKKARTGAPAATAKPAAAASPVAQPTQTARPAGVPADARQRSDGKWFWKRGNQWFEGTV